MGLGAWGILALRGPVLVLGVTVVAHFSVSQVVQFSMSVDTMPSFSPSAAPGGVPTVVTIQGSGRRRRASSRLLAHG